MKGVYPAVFTEVDGAILVEVPDLEILTEGKDFNNAIEMARDAIEMWLCIAEDRKEEIPEPTKDLKTSKGFVSLIDVDTTAYRKANDNRAVKKTLSIPSWLNNEAEKQGINFSQILQEALKVKLNIQ